LGSHLAGDRETASQDRHHGNSGYGEAQHTLGVEIRLAHILL